MPEEPRNTLAYVGVAVALTLAGVITLILTLCDSPF